MEKNVKAENGEICESRKWKKKVKFFFFFWRKKFSSSKRRRKKIKKKFFALFSFGSKKIS